MKYALLITGFATLIVAGCNETNKTATNTAPSSTDATRPAVATDATSPDASSPAGQLAAKPDNTGVNDRDLSNDNKTPYDHNEDPKNIDITDNIRKRVVDTKMLVNAQNVKKITQVGKVT